MTPLHTDIIRTIEKHGPITSEDIAERLTELGYGGGTCFDEFKRQVSKIASKLKASGKVIGDDIPQAKAKPMRVYRMVETEEMASDVAEIESVNSGYLEDIHGPITMTSSETVTPEPVAIQVEAARNPLTARQLLDAFEESGESFQGDLCDFRLFSAGAEFAEKYHGIGQ